MANTFSFYILLTSMVVVSFRMASASKYVSNDGFSIELVHRDSPMSPYYNPSETPSQRLIKAIKRSIQRSNNILESSTARKNGTPVSTIVSIEGEYVMNISIGTPPFKIVANVDTGSSLIWTQCQPCTHCFKQANPIFDPRKSPTFKKLTCASRECKSMPTRTACDKERSCYYQYDYVDGSFTHGNIAIDRVSLDTTSGSLVSFPKTIIGCGYDNEVAFSKQTSGIIGLGAGSVSLISQMGQATGGIFSYCLVPHFGSINSSKLNFGVNARVSGKGVVTTPLVLKGGSESFYFVTLEGVTVGKTRIPISNSSNSLKGNMVIDSGTTLTLLPPGLFDEVRSEIVKQVKLKQVDDPQRFLSLCFNSRSDEVPLPAITMHFDGADVKLSSRNTFVRVAEDLLCFSMNPNPQLPILGNLAQINFEVGYDIAHRKVSFKPTDCTKQ